MSDTVGAGSDRPPEPVPHPPGPERSDAAGATGPVAVVVLDVDGVVADVRHRLHHLARRPADWPGFFADAAHDPPLDRGVALARELAARQPVVWLTGRPERLRVVTLDWLARHGLPDGPLVMRPNRDYRPARRFKRDALRVLRRIHPVALVVDDDPDVVRMAERDGFAVRLADWAPRSDVLHAAQEANGRT